MGRTTSLAWKRREVGRDILDRPVRRARANLEVALGRLADRVVAELSSGWEAERQPEADAGRTDSPARRRP
ncbi:MAG TPA: hypothetical protein PKL73_15580 [Polyangiaceae bacterium]|nr:hypothetical protein [Polyangiaceae bacterium]HNZ22845.1 hypothetical protein [Polyangiaceae bacterium]HOH00532.1 hypothetical protein [Polyangiaceae bacterium]HOR35860.1 hypothetical protein [Polyangiaceae bacterium]HPK93813.1 hypothetical protein [Polyangiaceae bacterium]